MAVVLSEGQLLIFKYSTVYSDEFFFHKIFSQREHSRLTDLKPIYFFIVQKENILLIESKKKKQTFNLYKYQYSCIHSTSKYFLPSVL